MLIVPDFKINGLWIKHKGSEPNRTRTNAYRVWYSMINRCTDGKAVRDKYKNYLECSVSENFKDFQYFAEWCQSQVGYGVDGYQLDKDILIKGNKIYSEDTCAFVPSHINSLILKLERVRGECPIGVVFEQRRNKYMAHMSYGNSETRFIGYFNTSEDAFYAYKFEKEKFIKEQVAVCKDAVDPRIYDALMRYEILITD